MEKLGFTCFDTALMYCGAKSESTVKQDLTSRHKRDTYTLATKLLCIYLKTMAFYHNFFMGGYVKRLFLCLSLQPKKSAN